MAIIPDFNNSELTFGPTFSTLLKLNESLIDFISSFFIDSISLPLVFFFSILMVHYSSDYGNKNSTPAGGKIA